MRKTTFSIILNILMALSVSACAYRWGSPERHIPGGYNLIAVPVFTNKTQEAGAESYFTQAMIMEIEKSSLAKVTSKEDSQAILLGEVSDIHYEAGAQVSNLSPDFQALPQTAVLTQTYRVVVLTHVKLIRSSDMAILWQGNFKGSQPYAAPLIINQVKNTADPLYNQSAHMMNIQQLSQDMMSEAFGNMTENF